MNILSLLFLIDGDVTICILLVDEIGF